MTGDRVGSRGGAPRWSRAGRRPGRPERPEQVFDEGLQHERTALAWERTAIASMVAGVLMARYAAQADHYLLSSVGVAQVVLGSILLVWTGRHYDELHGPLRSGVSPVHPTAARRIGLATVVFSASGVLIAIVVVFDR